MHIRHLLPTMRFGVIDDARRRQRRRWLASLALVLLAVAAATVVAERPAGEPIRQPAPPPAAARLQVREVAPSAVLSRSPYMGVACPTPNSTRCDRLGLSVWLKRPAAEVTAVIGGRPVPLDSDWIDDRQSILAAHGKRRTQFSGFLQPAGLRSRYHLPTHWTGRGTPQPGVRLSIDDGLGHLFKTRLRVDMMAGWG
jgi:hypothetical protein